MMKILHGGHVRRGSEGFTLIELLVVIAIIGLLAAVVLASISSARQKGGDAAVKSNLDGIRASAELSASNNNNSYVNVCVVASEPGIGKAIDAAKSAAGITTATVVALATPQAASGAVCHSNATGWVVSVPLLTSNTTYWCVDGDGAAKTEVATVVTGGSVNCP